MKALKIAGKILGIAVNVVLIAFILANLYTIIARMVFKVENPRLFGIASAVVETDSMKGDREDSIAGNDMVFTIVRSEYEIDDVIMFETTHHVTVTHRIIGWDEEAGGFIKLMRQPMGMMILGIALILLIGIPLLFGKEEE